MARNHDNFKPKRSRRSGRKKLRLIKSNLEVLKKIALVLFITFSFGCITTKYVMVDPKDSTKLVEIKKRIIYDDYLTPNPYPFFYNDWFWFNRPLYRPIIIQTPRPQPRPQYVPVRPTQPRYNGPQFGPLPPAPRPRIQK